MGHLRTGNVWLSWLITAIGNGRRLWWRERLPLVKQLKILPGTFPMMLNSSRIRWTAILPITKNGPTALHRAIYICIAPLAR